MPDDKVQLKILKESEFDPNNTQEKKSGWPKQAFHVSHLREEDFKNDGFRAIKMKIGLGDLKLDAARVGAVRQAIGPDVKLAVDANHCFSVPNAIKLGRMLEEHDILWFEEPVSPEDHDGYIEVTRALDMAVAGGENDFTRWGFRDVIAKKAMDIVQPNVCAAGGITDVTARLYAEAVSKVTGQRVVVENVGGGGGAAAGVVHTDQDREEVLNSLTCRSPRPYIPAVRDAAVWRGSSVG